MWNNNRASRIEMVIAAGRSHSGKTIITCGMLEYLRRKGYSPAAFKCGPDYIDPMYHRSVEGVSSYNLDLYLADEDTVKGLYERYSRDHDAVVIEGVMGFYDGVGGTSQASTYDLGRTLDIPVLYVIDAEDIPDLTAVKDDISAVFLNKCSADDHTRIREIIESEYGIPIAGYLPYTDHADLGSRHLGLLTAAEIEDLSKRIAEIADMLGDNVDQIVLKRLFSDSR